MINIRYQRMLRLLHTFLIAALVLGVVPGASASPAETVAVAAAAGQDERPIEYWIGAITRDYFDGEGMPCWWICPGEFHDRWTEEWDVEVYGDGYVRGYVKIRSQAISYRQSEKNDFVCGPVSGNPTFVNRGCTYGRFRPKPYGELFVEGKRNKDFLGRPQIEIERSIVLVRGIDMYTVNANMHDVHTDASLGPYFEQRPVPFPSNNLAGRKFLLVPATDDRAPRGLYLGKEYRREVVGKAIFTHSGYLVGYIQDPALWLDMELLEQSTFLQQVPVDDLYTADVEWNTTDDGWVTWQLGEAPVETVGPTQQERVPKNVNVGAQPLGRTTLTVRAENTLGKKSQPQTTVVDVTRVPEFAAPAASVSAIKIGGAAQYKRAIKWPEPALEGTVQVWDWVPFFGGKKIGLTESQLVGEVEVLSTSEGTLKGFGQTGFEAAGGKVVGTLGGKGKGVLDKTGWSVPEASVEFSIGGKIEKEEPLLKAIPTLAPLVTAVEKVSKVVADYLKNKAKAKLELEPKVEFAFNFSAPPGGSFQFDSGEAKPAFGYKTTAEVELIEDVAVLGTGVGGEVAIALKVPPPVFKEASLKGLVFGKVQIGKWGVEGEQSWTVVIGPGAYYLVPTAPSPDLAAAAGEWRLLDRSYLGAPVYALWVAETQPQSAAAAPSDTLLVQNVYPQANPSLAARVAGNSVTLLQTWTHDKPGLPAVSSGEIAWSQRTGATWSAPAYLTNDSRDDWNPKVVYLPNGKALAIWQRMDADNPGDMNVDARGYWSHAQIAARVVGNPGPSQLSASSSLNHRHQLGATASGALAVWVNNPANELVGAAGHPDRILFADYNQTANTWSAPAVLLNNVQGLVALDLATNGAHAALVYSLDADGDFGTESDRELFYVQRTGATWSAPVQLTNNALVDQAPELVLTPAGAPQLVWQQEGRLQFLDGAWNATAQALSLPGAAERTDYELQSNPIGALALTWQEAEPGQTVIGYALYDAAARRWSAQRQYEPPAPPGDPALVSGMATRVAAALLPPVAANPAQLLLGYQLAHVESITRTIDGAQISGVPQITQHDLRFATLPLGVDLHLDASDLTAPDATTIQAVLHNGGDLATTPTTIRLTSGVTETVSLDVNAPAIAGGEAVTLTFSLPPDMREAGVFKVHADPAQTVVETNEDNNIAFLRSPIELTMLPVQPAEDRVVLGAVARQTSLIYTAAVISSTVHVGALDGPVVGGAAIDFTLPSAGTIITPTVVISATMLGAGSHDLFWVVEREGEGAPAAYATATARIAPDLTAKPERIGFGRAPGSQATFVMDVRNLGNWPNTGSSVAVYDGLPGRANTHELARLALPAIPPGQSAEVTGNLNLTGLPAATTGLQVVYVWLDPAGVIAELNENNNLVAAGDAFPGFSNVRFPVYLPLMQNQ